MVRNMIGDVRLSLGGGRGQINLVKGVVEIDKIEKVWISMF